jgi:UPF0755 protein
MFKLFFRLLVLAALAGAGFAAWLYWYAQQPLPLVADSVEFRIEPGSGLRGAIRQMRTAGVEVKEWPFVVLARAAREDGSIKAGTYDLRRGTTPNGLLDKLVRGDFAQSNLRVVEGWTFKQFRAVLDGHPHIKHTTAGMSEEEVMRRIGAPGLQAEGRFFPDTYRFPKGESDIEILRQAYSAMTRKLEEAWAGRAPDLPLATPYDALILASIVEKETGVRGDRDLIAAVFINRLRYPMRLQTDPTVIYGMGAAFNGNLRKVDLQTDTPYNTYTRDGLPPTPIALPGIESLQAVTHPGATQALYFVARGDGSSHFSESLNEHNQAVDRYQRGGRSAPQPRSAKR